MAGYYEDIYIENLFKDSGLEKQLKAVKELAKLQSKRAVPKLKEISVNTNANITLRLNTILALAEIGERTFIKEFLPLKNQAEIEIIETVIISIGKLKAVEYISEFDEFINSGNREIKVTILETLDKINDESSIKMLIKFYSDNDIEIKEIVKFYLQKSSTFTEVSKEMSDDEILNILTIVPKERAAELIKRMIEKSENKTVLKILIKALGELDIENNIELLKLLFNREEDKRIKIMVIEAMEKLNDKEKKSFLLEILKSEDRDIKTKALMSLGNFSNDLEVTEYLKSIILNKEEWWMTKKIAAIIFSKSHDEKKAEFIAGALENEEDSRVVRTLIQELGEIGSKDYTFAIQKYLNSKDIEVQKVSMYALSKLGDKEILEFLINNEDARENLMPESLKAMLNFDDIRVSRILIDVLKKRRDNEIMLNIAIDGLDVIRNSEVMTVLIEIVKDKKYKRELRAKAVMILASYKEKKVEEIIKTILEDNEEWWMIKKLALILCKELEIFSLINIVIDYAAELDDRLNKTARETAKYFYENYFLKEFKQKESILYEIAKKYSKLL